MSRRIVSTQLQANQAGSVDTYFDRVVKYIPADIIAAWTTATGLIAVAAGLSRNVLWIVFFVLLVLTPFWIMKTTDKPNQPHAKTQIAIGTIAFAVWVFALGGPFAQLGFYKPVYGSLILIFYTLVVALIQPKE